MTQGQDGRMPTTQDGRGHASEISVNLPTVIGADAEGSNMQRVRCPRSHPWACAHSVVE